MVSQRLPRGLSVEGRGSISHQRSEIYGVCVDPTQLPTVSTTEFRVLDLVHSTSRFLGSGPTNPAPVAINLPGSASMGPLRIPRELNERGRLLQCGAVC